MRALLVACGVSFLVSASACSSSSSAPDSTGDCDTVCNAETVHSCTSVSSCASYCDSIEGVASSGNCKTQINAYVACAKTATVCGVKNACTSQASDFSSCARIYCDANTTDTNCVALSDSL